MAFRTAALVAAGVAVEGAAFPPISSWPLVFLLLAPLAVFADCARPRAAFAFAWVQQALAAAFVVRWLLHALVIEYGALSTSSLAFLLLLVGSYAVVPASAVALYAAASKRIADWAAPLGFAALFVLAEALRAGPLALPWVLIGQPLAAAPFWLQSAEFGGVYAPGFVAGATGAGLGIAFRRRSLRPLAAPATLLALAAALGALRLSEPVGKAGAQFDIGVVQAAVPLRERFRPGSALRSFEKHLELTHRLAAESNLDLVVWAESSIGSELDAIPWLGRVAELARDIRAPVLTGAPLRTESRLFNTAVLLDESGVRATYAKQMLLPFAEYDPPWIGFLAPLLGPVSEGESYVPGQVPTLLPGPIPIAAPICFEITDPDLVRGLRNAGAGLLVNLSNDAWFGRTGYAEMHLGHAILRAVELRTWLVRGTNTGISAVIDPAGRVVAQLGLFEEGTLAARVGATEGSTFFALYGSAPWLGLLATLCFAAPLTGTRWIGTRRRGESKNPGTR